MIMSIGEQQQIMDIANVGLLSTSEEVVRGGVSDASKFLGMCAEIVESGSMAEDEVIAQKIGPLSQSQVHLMQSQVLAYKHLIRNIPVPTSLSWSGLQANAWPSEKDKLTTKTVTFYRDKVEREPQLKAMITGHVRTSSTPRDAHSLAHALLHNRTTHLLTLSSLTPDAHRRLSLEAHFLQATDTYHSVVSKVTKHQDTKATLLFEKLLLDRTYFRRERLHKNREGGGRVQKLENQMKSDHEKRKKIKHKQFMQHLRAHKEQQLEWHKRKQKDRKKLANQAKTIWDNKKKEKEGMQDKKSIERLQALAQQDMKKYFLLVKEAKNNKINQLLNETNKFLKELGAKVVIQKGGNSDEMVEVEGELEEDMENNFIMSNNVYYNLTHTVKEEIKQQPQMLEGGELKNYQLVGLQWLVSLYNNNLNGILADEMGLGKTIQTISLFSYLMQFKKNYGPFLIVVPLSTISNWLNEFDKWAPSIRKIVYRGNPVVRGQIQKKMKQTKWNVCLTTYDFILKDRQKLNKYDWKYIVIDEGHKMKNAKSKFAGVLGQQYHSTHRLLLTGTPFQNNLSEMWALLNFLLPKVFNSCDDFQKWFSMAISKRTGQKEKESVQLNEEEQLLIINRLHQVLRPFLLRRVKSEVEVQLPEKKEYVVKVELSAWQKLIYDNIEKKTTMQFQSSGGKVNTNTLTNLVMQLRKCCNHPYLFLRNYDDIAYHDWIFRTSGKFQLLDRILPKLQVANHRALIFSQMTHLMDIMKIYFDYKGVKHLRLDGSTKQEDRGERTSLFNAQNSQYDVFLLSTRAGGLGLNLQSADTVIIFDSDWNPQMDLQAQDRAHRIGQKKEVVVLRFVTNTPIEEAILQKAAFKMNLDQLLIQGGLYNLNSSEAERKQKIQDLLKRRRHNDDNQEDEIHDDEMINKFIARTENQYETFTRMDEERYEREKTMYPNYQDGFDGEKKRINYRLMREDEIPSWFIQTPKTVNKHQEYGKGHRLHKQVNYYDNEPREIDDSQESESNSSRISVPKRKNKLRNRKQKSEQIVQSE